MKFNKNHEIFDSIAAGRPDLELIFLESQMKEHPSSIRSFAAIKPKRWIRAAEERITIFDGTETREFSMDPWDALKKFKNSKKCWLFGYLGYDLKNNCEELQSKNKSLYQLPDLYFMEPESLLIIENGEIQEVGLPLPHLPSGPESDIKIPRQEIEVKELITKDDYVQAVKKIKERITEGDFYELNFSYAMRAEWHKPAYELYKKMRDINPVPFGAFIKMREGAVCSISPERFLKKEGNQIVSEPIKGTSERSENKQDDERLKQDLLNEKNRAENLMIVDLVRHDLSRISKIGSVKVQNLFDVQTFGTVHQLISTIAAEAEKDTDSVDIIRKCFPMGSMTGAPKVAVMKAIEELENYRRGVYSGAIGYFNPNDDFDFNVVIRTAILQNNIVVYPVGGAITSDSDAELEWKETIIKARSLTKVFLKDAGLTK